MVNPSYETQVSYVKRHLREAPSDQADRPLSEDDLDAISVLALAAAALVDQATEVLNGAGYPVLRPSHARLIAQLIGGERSVTELAFALGITPQAVSKAVGPLAAEDSVEISPGRDARVRVVGLTARGREAVMAARVARDAVSRTHEHALADVRSSLLDVLRDLGALDAALQRRFVP